MPQLKGYMEKFTDDDLRHRAAEHSPDEASVIVELNLPARKVEMRKGTGPGAIRHTPIRVVPPTPEEREETERAIAGAREFLARLLGQQPHWLDAARAFVVTANGEQLRQIANSPAVKAIRFNRRLKA